ncbi:MAG: Unknown protein [uncultured Sulfurovum sp.]|uniref:Uncharacterized protein n=1 Tax=uncultured Sulfurovum sp. TaxID=269237 RepID=A0A6S6TTP6_9BACT|nr:MAG: Unknown protein [uncultured Sulfurovum sp.]
MKEDVELDIKLNKTLLVQARYNEINNYDIPKLFSKDIEGKVVPSAKKLSEHKQLKNIIIKLLLKALDNDKLNYAEEIQIKDVLRDCYNWTEKKKED